jgi:excisionase family DNA binding protein
MKEAIRGTLTVPEAAELLGVHKLTAYDAIRRGDFPVPVIKVGRRYVVPVAALDRLLSGREEK